MCHQLLRSGGFESEDCGNTTVGPLILVSTAAHYGLTDKTHLHFAFSHFKFPESAFYTSVVVGQEACPPQRGLVVG